MKASGVVIYLNGKINNEEIYGIGIVVERVCSYDDITRKNYLVGYLHSNITQLTRGRSGNEEFGFKIDQINDQAIEMSFSLAIFI